MEKERQEAIKRKTLAAFGKPPPNFRLMMAEHEIQARQGPTPEVYVSSPSALPDSDRPSAMRRSASMTGLAWRDAIVMKKQQEVSSAAQHILGIFCIFLTHTLCLFPPLL